MTPAETAAFLRQFNEWRRGDEDIPQPDPRVIGEAIDAAVEMIDRLEAAEKSDAESIAMYRKARDEHDALRAKIETMERQAPVAWTTKLALEHRESALGFRVSSVNIWGEKGVPLYALPGAHPKPDCGEAGHDEGRCGNKQCLSGAQTQGEEK